MATRKMTITLPANLAEQFVKRIPARHRSRYLAEALTQKLSERDQQLIRACEVANRIPEVQAIENEFDAIAEEVHEPWSNAPTRRGVVGAARPYRRVRD